MIPVYQQFIDPKIGDCTRACIASILELSLDDVPNFNFIPNTIEHCDADQYWDNIISYLDKLGYGILSIYNRADDKIHSDINLPPLIDCHVLLSVPSQKYSNGLHHVVGKFTKQDSGIISLDIVHDPNQSNDKYPDDVKIHWAEFIFKK